MTDSRTRPAPRIPPATRRELKPLDVVVTRVLGAATGGAPPNVFTTLARHPKVFRRWLRFASALMPGGTLPRADSELVILRVAHNCDCDYELHHHERLALLAGLDEDAVGNAKRGPSAPGWTHREQLLLRAADELHDTRTVSDELWSELAATFNDVELIELCMLVGHYEMVAMTLNALGVQPDAPPSRPPSRVLRIVQTLIEKRQAHDHVDS